jgi:hypothetical protein
MSQVAGARTHDKATEQISISNMHLLLLGDSAKPVQVSSDGEWERK